MTLNHASPEDILDIIWYSEDTTDSNNFTEEVEEWDWSASTIQISTQHNTQKLDYICQVDRKNQHIVLKARNWNIIGQIWKWTFKRGKFSSNNHLYKKIEEEYRWKWFGTILFEEYISAGFLFPEFEYTRKEEVIYLMEKFWYKIFSIVDMYGNENPIIYELDAPQIQKYLRMWYVIWLIKAD